MFDDNGVDAVKTAAVVAVDGANGSSDWRYLALNQTLCSVSSQNDVAMSTAFDVEDGGYGTDWCHQTYRIVIAMFVMTAVVVVAAAAGAAVEPTVDLLSILCLNKDH